MQLLPRVYSASRRLPSPGNVIRDPLGQRTPPLGMWLWAPAPSVLGLESKLRTVTSPSR